MSTRNVLEPLVHEVLTVTGKIFKKHQIDFYLIGATARDILLSKDSSYRARRATRDVDLAILVSSEEEFHKLKDFLLEDGDFTASRDNVLRLLYKNSIEVDLLPFGEIENESREVRIVHPELVISVPGFKELLPFVVEMDVDGTVLNVCPLEGIIILKLFAYSEKREQRTKDLTDIEHFIDAYFDLNKNEIYGEEYFDVLNLYQDVEGNDFELFVSQRVVGRKIRKLLSEHPELLEKIKEILQAQSPPSTYWLEMAAGLED
jgi:predicted nucleotidyltransferase